MNGAAKAPARNHGATPSPPIAPNRSQPPYAIFEGAAIGMCICSLDGYILRPNSALASLLGYVPEELIGMHTSELRARNVKRESAHFEQLRDGTRRSLKEQS